MCQCFQKGWKCGHRDNLGASQFHIAFWQIMVVFCNCQQDLDIFLFHLKFIIPVQHNPGEKIMNYSRIVHEQFMHRIHEQHMNSSWMVLEHEMVLFMKGSWIFQGREFRNCSWTFQCTWSMNSSREVLEHEMVLFVKLQQYIWTLHKYYRWIVREHLMQFIDYWANVHLYLKGVSSLTPVHYLWRSFGSFSLSCVQK